jgi:hypothetical protein
MKKHIHKSSEKELYFSEVLEPMVKYIKETWDIEAKPKGYDEFCKDYEDYKGLPCNEEKLKDAFDGLSDGSAGSFSFPIRVALEHVAYSDHCQGRDPINELLGAFLGYGIMVGMRIMGIKNEKAVESIAMYTSLSHDLSKDQLKDIKKIFDLILEYENYYTSA